MKQENRKRMALICIVSLVVLFLGLTIAMSGTQKTYAAARIDVTVTNTPSMAPTEVPPTAIPTNTPVPPTAVPTNTPIPTVEPTNTPVPPTAVPTEPPVPQPTAVPTETPLPVEPTVKPTLAPTETPVVPTAVPTHAQPTSVPEVSPTPTVVVSPTSEPTVVPTPTQVSKPTQVVPAQQPNQVFTAKVIGQTTLPVIKVTPTIQDEEILVTVQVINTRSGNQGWSLTVNGSGLTDSKGTVLPTSITGVSGACVGTCTPAVSTVSYPIPVNGSSHEVYSAATKSGKGTINVTIRLHFQVGPANSAGNYGTSLAIYVV